ncbi:alpha/beta-hydrolase [Ascobolus immersus RN42]|uniref:Alpha/beta-hydrolase n=1 Tax=Ascobolus immersus RN42 TaxID=1160509 RepID=A0A3N4IF75_ASCIM|nr:alpha/beta-hydrolase [Ascobolus immersus RN42]
MNALSLASIVTTGSSLISTTVHHLWNRKAVKGTPHADLTYHQGVNLLRDFLDLCTDHIVEDLQALTSKDIPVPPNIHLERIKITKNFLDEAAEQLIEQLGEDGIEQVGGREWWQWRDKSEKGEEVDYLKAEWVETKRHKEEKKLNPEQAETIVLYIHGGAFYFGSAETMRFQVQTWAKKINARILTPSYRLAPQYPFPCALQDALAAYLYILSAHPASRVLVLGDSAGGNLCLSLLVTLRDRGIPLPAGGILLSPWVDLAHSFPSILEENDRDYIPKHGFRHKPSVAWPPPAVEDLQNLANKSNAGSPSKQHVDTEQGEKGYTERPASEGSTPTETVPAAPPATQPPSDHITFEIDGKKVTVKDQIHMYTVNSLIAHPLVSPVNQGSLGGLCPLLITSGGAEVLRDEHTYIAHKATHPKKYPPNPLYMNDRQKEALDRWPPTKVKFQVFDHCCHVVTALNYTRPAKYMNRSIGTFGKWAIEYAKKQQSIDYKSDDSIKSTPSDNSSLHIVTSPAAQVNPEATAKEIEDAKLYEEPIGTVKKVSTDIGQFENHMIRERVDSKGRVYRLRPASTYPCLHIPPSEIGVVKPGPLQIWLEGQNVEDAKYGALRKKMQDKQLQALLRNNQEENLKERGERPPPSALYRRRYKDEIKPTPSRESGLPASLWARWAQKEPKNGDDQEEGKNDEFLPVSSKL